ncbi:PilT/PilU family type 4a pilus ATPase [Homoserinimonas sp. OAct 916]|uniref:PilT/PilU family type 4a pilus ATPase n=1 Tax=Homoserinimonas sp. OAct 916 TaxID=2211450 RepID=UPI0018E4F67D|nr:PilT/PilU family type 4a pilus ATPase [Homoserinimonas sp. OAct 916]
MDKPVYDIPVTPPGTDAVGWLRSVIEPGTPPTPAADDVAPALPEVTPSAPIPPRETVAHPHPASAAPPFPASATNPLPARTPTSFLEGSRRDRLEKSASEAAAFTVDTHAEAPATLSTPVAAPTSLDAGAAPTSPPADAAPTAPPMGAPVGAAPTSLDASTPAGSTPITLPEGSRSDRLEGAPPALPDESRTGSPEGATPSSPPEFRQRRAADYSRAETDEEHSDKATSGVPAEPRLRRAADRRRAQQDPDPDLIAALAQVLAQNGSDLHITTGAPPSIRVDGGLRPLEGYEKWMPEKVTAALQSIITPLQAETFATELELDFAYTAVRARFRVNYYQQRNSIGAAFRLIPYEIKQLKDLGVPESVGRFAELARGLVLVTGPTGSGKSTTLAALVDLVNRTRNDHIVTVEDPIEFLHSHQKSLVNQREVGQDTHSFASALKHVLRQDPDVILVGELRDLETISVALTAAETGHLVFATLHTQDAAQTIDRVIDVFPPHQQGQVRSQLAATLQGVVCQTLVKKASGSGRVVATEVMIATPAVNNLIREGKTYQIASAMQAGRELGMHTMDQHLADLVNAGQITRQAAEEKAQDVVGLKQLIQRVESPSDGDIVGGIDFGDKYSGGGR